MLTELILVRHGESEGNRASAAADRAHAEVIDIEARDADVDLSPLGRVQAEAFGRWLAEVPGPQRPRAVASSPYVRARETAEVALRVAGLHPPMLIDERLRDRELGVLDRLTERGVAARYPDEAARRVHLGKLYYRPPGGESWSDVVLRLRSFLRDLQADPPGSPILVAAHDVVILLIRYVLERFDERQLMAIAASEPIRNGAVTRLVCPDPAGPWHAAVVNDVSHLVDQGVPSTGHEGRRDVDS